MIRRQKIVDRLGDFDVFRQERPFRAQPAFQVFDQRCRLALANGKTSSRVVPIDLALDGEESINPLHRLEGDRRYLLGGFAFADVALDIGQFEELAACMAPAQRRRDRPGLTCWIVELIVATKLKFLLRMCLSC